MEAGGNKAGPTDECRTRHAAGAARLPQACCRTPISAIAAFWAPIACQRHPSGPAGALLRFGPQSTQLELLHTCFCSHLRRVLGGRRSGWPGEEKMQRKKANKPSSTPLLLRWRPMRILPDLQGPLQG